MQSQVKTKLSIKIFKINITYQVQYQHHINGTTNKLKNQTKNFNFFLKKKYFK